MSNPFENQAEAQNTLRALSSDSRELHTAAGGPVADALTSWLAAQYAIAGRDELTAAHGAQRLEILRGFVRDWSLLRRGDHKVARLQLERETLDWRRTCTEAEKQKEFRQWVERPEVRAELFPEHTGGVSPETMRMIEEAARLL